MSERPWEPHRVATAAEVRAAVRSRFPDVEVEGIRRLGSGWECDAWLSPDGWVFRFPRRPEAPAQLRRERRFLALARRALSPAVAVPEPELSGDPGEAFPWPFARHRLVEGVAADHPAVPEHPGLASQIGDALGRIHAVPAQEARRAGAVGEPDGPRAWTRDLDAGAVERLRDVEAAVEGPLAWFEAGPPLPDEYRGPLRFIHDDLCPDHVLLDPATGALAGIIDWTDAALGDPVLDFVFLATWKGWGFTRRVVAAYPGPLDPGFGERLAYMTRVVSLHWLARALETGGDGEKEVLQVVRAFGEVAGPPGGGGGG